MKLLSTTTIGMMASQTTMTISTIVQRSMKLSEMTMLVRGMMIYVVTSMDSFAKRNEVSILYLCHTTCCNFYLITTNDSFTNYKTLTENCFSLVPGPPPDTTPGKPTTTTSKPTAGPTTTTTSPCTQHYSNSIFLDSFEIYLKRSKLS